MEEKTGLTVFGQVILGRQLRNNVFQNKKMLHEKGYCCAAESHPDNVYWNEEDNVTPEMLAAFENNEYALPESAYTDWEVLTTQLAEKQQPKEGWPHEKFRQPNIYQPPNLSIQTTLARICRQ